MRLDSGGNHPGSDEHLTPPEIWDRLYKIAPSWRDPCPHPWNGVDAFASDSAWSGEGPWYCNPPFTRLWDAANRCSLEPRPGVFLAPTRTSQPFWSRLMKAAAAVAFWTGDKDCGGKIPRRVRFLNAEGQRQPGAPFDTALFLLDMSGEMLHPFVDAFKDVSTILIRDRVAHSLTAG